MDYFQTEQLSRHLYRLRDRTGVQMYLAVGRTTAALIDTGSGIGELNTEVRRITGKPLIVLLTHGHAGHAMGAAAFDVVYMNRRDAPVFLEHAREDMRRRCIAQSLSGTTELPEVLLPAPELNHLIPMGNGDVFDLGGLHVRMLACPGHTPGSMTALIEEERILITGDAVNSLTFLFLKHSLPVAEFRQSLQQLRSAAEGRFDTVLFSHGESEGQKTILSDAVDLCDRILGGCDDGKQEYSFMGYTGRMGKAADDMLRPLDGSMVNIIYRPEAKK